LAKNKKRKIFSSAASQKTLHKNLEFTATEQYKLLRTNLSFTLQDERKCQIIGVTSSIRGEGKSTTSINLSYVLAESGKRVMLIDGDLRIPSVAKKMNIEETFGLTDLLRGIETIELSSFKTAILDNWYVMPSGPIPPNPSELLGSRRMGAILDQLSEYYDYIVVDLPPVNLVSDALAISKYISGMIVVVREDHTEKRDLETCMRQLKLSNVNVLGCVMNESNASHGYYGKYKYKRYYKYYKTHDEKTSKVIDD